MEEYKSRLSAYLSDLVREELEKYDGGFTDEWNDQRKKNAEVLGYKLAGTSDISEGIKDPKLKVGQKIRFKKSNRVFTLKKITHGNRGIPEDPAGTSYMFVAPGNRKEYHTKKTWAQAIKKGWLSLESVNEEITDWQGGYNDEFKFKKGQLIRDINPDCPHHGSEGEVTKVTKDEVTYTVRNNGKTYKVGDELTKTKDQLTPLSIDESIDEKMGPEQFHKYMQYVFDTQFKTPEEKKMKKSIIKKINKAQKKKGLPLFKESINEGKWSKIMTSVRKGSKAGPWSIVVYDKRERKVKHQRLVKILQQIPAHYEDVKKKYPRDKIGIEDKYGERVYTESVNETSERDYKAEYKKYGSSTKAKKYRAELNQYNRKKGTYGNNDGKDASHKGGKIVGFEKESTNRGRREKSRLKKEDIREDVGIETYLGGILKGMKKAGLKLKSAQVMKHGWSKSKDKIGFFIKVEKREIEGKKLWTLQLEVDRDGYLWYLSAPKDIKIGKWADTSQLVRGFKKLNYLPGFGQDAIFKRRR